MTISQARHPQMEPALSVGDEALPNPQECGESTATLRTVQNAGSSSTAETPRKHRSAGSRQPSSETVLG